MELQKTFKESYMKKLRDAVKSGEALPLYAKDQFEIDQTQVKRLANVRMPDNSLAEKMIESYDNDFKAGVLLFEAYKNISPLLASNETFWAYLTHTSLFQYSQKRWPNVKTGTASSNYVLDHWFIGNYGLLRNTCASLWWSVYNSIDETRENPYELSEILFSNYTLRVTTFGSGLLIRHREAMIGLLEFIKENPDIRQNIELRGQFISKYFNRLGAVKQLAFLNRDYFKYVCERMKDKILSIVKREQLQDESLYVDIV